MEISLEELKNRNYNQKGISNFKLYGKCEKCQKDFKYCAVKKFLSNRKNKIENWNVCQKCWLLSQTSENKVWIEKNRQAQLIAQNKPEQKKRNANGVSKSWNEERKKKESNYLKNKWATNKEFADKCLKNLDWTSKKDDRYDRIMSASLGVGGLKGLYNNIRYESALELSFILWCENEQIPIKRYDLQAIEYFDKDKTRFYIPDFIIYTDEIVEIKGSGLYYNKNYERNLLKIEAAKKKFLKYTILFETDECLKKFYKKARKTHYENKK